MVDEFVKVGDVEAVVVDVMIGAARPTSVEVRSFIEEMVSGVLTRKFDNGAAFTTTDALLSGTFSGGVWKGQYTWPSYGVDKFVNIESKPIGLSLDLTQVETRRILSEVDPAALQPVAFTF